MAPPTISALFLYFRPKTLPTFRPTAERMKVMQPMNSTAAAIFTPGSRARVIPTASASMLVATASSSMALGAKEASAVSSSLEKASFNILPPMTDSRMKATQ